MPLALGGLWITFVVVCGVGLIVVAIIAVFKMRSDDFWDKTDV
ncbi:MAG TPA: hypothetical protein VH420_08495 [Gaiellaceae bacterium]|jgi:hypothetical protein